jgi:hypothetical protein
MIEPVSKLKRKQRGKRKLMNLSIELVTKLIDFLSIATNVTFIFSKQENYSLY